MANSLKLALLGPPRVWLNDHPITTFRTAKAQALLYFLALADLPQSRATLVDLLWGTMGERAARRNLTKALSELRKIVPGHLEVGRQRVCLLLSPHDWVDVRILDAAAGELHKQPNEGRLRRAADVAQGDFLQGFEVHNAPEFELWLMTTRARCREQVVQILDHLAGSFQAAGDRRQAIAYTRRLLALDAWREEAHRRLVQLLAEDGQRSAALAQLEICRSILAEELGIAPSPETEALAQALRDGMLAAPHPEREVRVETGKMPAAAVKHNLPRPLTPFVGRERELNSLLAQLRDPSCRWLTLAGPGGIGKTRLAIESARRLLVENSRQAQPYEGIYFVPLASVRSRTGLIAAIAQATALYAQAGAATATQLFAALRTRRVLLLLDGFEHLHDHARLISELLLAAPGVDFLVTSRIALKMQEEWFVRLTGLSVPPVQSEPRPSARGDGANDDAVRLFEQSMRRVRGTPWPAAARAEVVEICRAVEGMPLAIELAASWLKALSPRQIAAEIGKSLDFLMTANRNVVERHRSMRTVLEQTWHLMSADEQAVFRRLAVFQGGFDRQAATAVAGGSLRMLFALIEKCLLRTDEHGRYFVHELVRQYAHEQLQAADDEAQLCGARHCTHYAAFAEQRFETIDASPRQMDVLDEVAGEWGNLNHAWRWAVRHKRMGDMWTLASVICAFCYYRGRTEEGAELMQLGLDILAHMLPSFERDRTLAAIYQLNGWLQLRQGEIQVAESAFQSAQRLYERCGAPFPPTVATDPALGLGCVANARGDYARALHHGEMARQRAAAQVDKKNLAYACYVLASALYASGDYAKAYPHAEQAYRLSLEVHQNFDIAFFLNTLGEIALAMGDYGKACHHYQASYAAQAEVGHVPGMADALIHLADIALVQAEIEEADKLFQDSLALHHQIGDQGGASAALVGLANCENAQADHLQALQRCAEAMGIAEEIEYVPQMLGAIVAVAEALLGLGYGAEGAALLELVISDPATRAPVRKKAATLLALQPSAMRRKLAVPADVQEVGPWLREALLAITSQQHAG